MANTPTRAVRIPDDVWSAARATANRRGENLTQVITAALRDYAAEHAGEGEPQLEAWEAAARARDALETFMATVERK